jgi:hypothetical protein
MESARKRSDACRMEGVDGMTGIHGARLGQTMIASLPETPKLDPLRVGKIVGALVRGRADEAEMRRASPLRRLESSQWRNKSTPSLLRQRTRRRRREAFVAECRVVRISIDDRDGGGVGPNPSRPGSPVTFGRGRSPKPFLFPMQRPQAVTDCGG